jgi:hypothetical protein
MAKTQYSGDIYKYTEDISKMQHWGVGLQMDPTKIETFPPNYFVLKGDTTTSDVDNVTITITTASSDEVTKLTELYDLEKV